MHIESSHFIFSPSDLTLFMDGPFASWMEHYLLTNPDSWPKPDAHDELMNVLQSMGNQHELAVLDYFEQLGLSVKHGKSSAATLAAMQDEADVIYQASLESYPFRGYADFLIKIEGDSALGNYHYEVWDTKLAKTVKPNFVIQLCCYADMLESIQGRRPEYITVVTGSQEQKRFRTAEYYYFYQNLKRNFLLTHQHFTAINCPDPASSRSWGRWGDYAEKLLLEVDHLVQVATITTSQIKKLNKAGINSMTALIHADSTMVRGMKPEIFERLKTQANIQKKSAGKEVPLYQLIPNEFGKKLGLALLPPESPSDVFFDIEGFPLEEGGLEYLWGVSYFDEQQQRQYRDFWAHNHDEERDSFKAFITWVYQRWQQDASMHIYHYASYEISACRKLMGRYGVCEYEVDQLLRNEVFVDLYKVVKGALILGEPRYSIKNVEHLYRGKRETEVGSAGDSVVVYERWRENPDGLTWETSPVLNSIRDYNIDDCHSTQELFVWLKNQQKRAGIAFLGKTEVIEPDIKEEIGDRILLRDRLLAKAQLLKKAGDEQLAHTHFVFAWSIEFHKREAKPVFWRLFDRLGLNAEELMDDIDCLANCQRTTTPSFKPTPNARNLVYEYSFDADQEFKGGAKQYYILGSETEDGKQCKAAWYPEGSDLQHGIIALQIKNEPDSPLSLIPDEYVNPNPIPEALARQVKAFEEGRLNNTAILDFLDRSIPRITHHQSGEPIAPSHDPAPRLQEIITSVLNLDNSYLVIQGPPGAGKTYTGKHLIAELVKRGKRIGISSNSHKAINNLLISTAKYCQKEEIKGHFACTKNTDSAIEELNIRVLDNKNIAEFLQPGCVIGTTAWGFSREELEQAFDYLFIDEAGQVSVANLIAMSQATNNIILMGDQMQLGQPSQGCHPEGSGLSILDYLLHATPTIPDDMGVFLGTTYRMHSAVNQFISDAIYEGKLEAVPENDLQGISIPLAYQGLLDKEAGIIAVPVMHEGNTQASDEEIEQIVSLANELLGRTFHAKDGTQRLIGWDDILFVAPYNHQVNKLRAALGEQAKVGSVDKFQGQEAPIVFLSMCASSANESPRGMSFLFDRNRINVAISRAQCMAIVVYSPLLLETVPGNIEQIAMMNLFCQLVQHR